MVQKLLLIYQTKIREVEMKKIEVLIVDDHSLVRQGLKQLIELKGYKCSSIDGDGEEAISKVQQFKPILSY